MILLRNGSRGNNSNGTFQHPVLVAAHAGTQDLKHACTHTVSLEDFQALLLLLQFLSLACNGHLNPKCQPIEIEKERSLLRPRAPSGYTLVLQMKTAAAGPNLCKAGVALGRSESDPRSS